MGPESTGKSVLAEKLAKHYNEEFVTEYARTYFEINTISEYTIEQVEHIYKTQLQMEAEGLSNSRNLLICDTALVTGKIWCEWVFGKTPDLIKEKMGTHMYDLYLLCDIDIPWIKDDQRKDGENRAEQMAIHEKELKDLQASYVKIQGEGDQRLMNAIQAIDEFLKSVAQSDEH